MAIVYNLSEHTIQDFKERGLVDKATAFALLVIAIAMLVLVGFSTILMLSAFAESPLEHLAVPQVTSAVGKS